MREVNQARRLLPTYAREERLQREQRLKDLGLWTKANEARSKSYHNKSDIELYSRLESNMNYQQIKLREGATQSQANVREQERLG